MTVEVPGQMPAVHHIVSFAVDERQVQDHFGQMGFELHLINATWGHIGNSMVGLLWNGDRWLSHHEDNTWWTCAE